MNRINFFKKMNNYKCHEFQCVDTTMIVKYYVTLFL